MFELEDWFRRRKNLFTDEEENPPTILETGNKNKKFNRVGWARTINSNEKAVSTNAVDHFNLSFSNSLNVMEGYEIINFINGEDKSRGCVSGDFGRMQQKVDRMFYGWK